MEGASGLRAADLLNIPRIFLVPVPDFTLVLRLQCSQAKQLGFLIVTTVQARYRRLLMADKRYQSSSSDSASGKYANYLEVGHNAFEFVLDFGQMYADDKPEQIHTRIVTGPLYAKEFLEVLEESIEQYEEAFGPITRDK